MEIDPRFKQHKKRAARRRARPYVLWGAIGGGALALIGLIGAGIATGFLSFGAGGRGAETAAHDHAGEEALQGYVSPFIDVPGDPMILRFDQSGALENVALINSPPGFVPERIGARLTLVRDTLVVTEERLITTLPSSREDFAFFQAQRGAAEATAATPRALSSPPDAMSAAVNAAALDIEGDSWGEDISGTSGAAESYAETVIENTTSFQYLAPEAARAQTYRDVFLRIAGARSLKDVLETNGASAPDVAAFLRAAEAEFPEMQALEAGHVVALRLGRYRGVADRLMQLSVYTGEAYIGSLALSGFGAEVAADPWVQDELFDYAEDDGAGVVQSATEYRLLDAFYSAALRNAVPSSVLGETIVMLSQAFDMESFARPGDTMVLLYAQDPGYEGGGPGQVLFAAIQGPGGARECYVYKPKGRDEFTCFKPGRGGGGGGALRDGMATPVPGGVLTSRFGPRTHPILKTVKLHKGVDWAAPTGTPVVAAFDGAIAFAGNGNSYGNLVKISHQGGRETRYAHLDQFSELAVAGGAVRAGDVIGFVGTTGRSTGPHLHFELYEAGTAVDPFGASRTAVAGAAVEQLTDRIIRVESGGDARAKNKLSSATGLGQFIDSTWLRMMRTYRPDLVDAMSKDELLELRFDPTLSREMVMNLARESEAYLQARGHQVTAGRLYLAHFLGAEGAHVALSADRSQSVLDVMGAGVVNANPFLTGKDIAYLQDWADRKMSGGRGGGGYAAAAVIPAEVKAFQEVIAGLLKEAG